MDVVSPEAAAAGGGGSGSAAEGGRATPRSEPRRLKSALSCTPADDAEIVAARVAAKQAELREARNPDLVLQEPPTRNQTKTSSAWRFGYVFQCPEGYKWGCLANEKCMALVSIKSRTSFVLTACTDHLRDVHGVGKSAAQAAAAARRVEQGNVFATDADQAMLPTSSKKDKKRYCGLLCASEVVINFLPYAHFEKHCTRRTMHYIATSALSEVLPVKDHGKIRPIIEDVVPVHLMREAVKHHILELYDAAMAGTRAELRAIRAASVLPPFHLNLDLWTDVIAAKKYVGVRIFYMGLDMKLVSRLLAVKLFNPPAQLLGSERLSDLLAIWLEQVLAEVELAVDDVFSSTSDSGSDVKRLFVKVFQAHGWSWCISHLANVALKEGFGAKEGSASKNPEARDLLKAIKKEVTHLSQSKMKTFFTETCVEHLGYALKLVNDAPHRWSSAVKVFERVLELWSAIVAHYDKNEKGATFSLADRKQEIIELYSIMKPVHDVIKVAQGLDASAGLDALFGMGSLLVGTLACDKPLKICCPDLEAERSVDAHKAGLADLFLVTEPAAAAGGKVEQWNLTAVASQTRELLREAVVNRFFHYKYGPWSPEAARLLLDLQAAMTPRTMDLHYLQRIMQELYADGVTTAVAAAAARVSLTPALENEAESAGLSVAAYRKWKRYAACIEHEVQQLAIQHCSGVRERRLAADTAAAAAAAAASAGGDAGAEPAAKRPRTAADFFRKSSRAAAAAVAASSENGLLGEPLARAAGPRINVGLLPAENVVASEWAKFKAGFGFAKTTDAYGKPLPEQPLDWGFDGAGFWRQKKLQELYPNLAAAARVVFGHPASAAAIERDFERAGHLLTAERSVMDAAFAEMVLFLNADKGMAIPSNLRTVPELKKHPKTVHQHERMPRRLNNMGEISRALSISTQLKLRQQGSAFELTQDSDSD